MEMRKEEKDSRERRKGTSDSIKTRKKDLNDAIDRRNGIHDDDHRQTEKKKKKRDEWREKW